MPQLLSVVVDVLGEVEHDGDPHVVRSDLHIAVVVVRAEEGTEETVGVGSSVRRLAGLFVRQQLLLSTLRVEVLHPDGGGRAGTGFQCLNAHNSVVICLHDSFFDILYTWNL
jgi:hypothetical protein